MRGQPGLAGPEAVALILALLYIGLLGRELRDRYRILPVLSVPVMLILLAGDIRYAMAVRRSKAVYWALGDGPTAVHLAVGGMVALGTLGLLALLRSRRRRSHPSGRRPARHALFGGIAVYVILAATWVPRGGWPQLVAHPKAAIRACVLDPNSLGTFGEAGVLWDVIPNVALFVPLGISLALLLRHRVLALLLVIAVTVGTELYQAALTDRVCATNDMLTNTCGGLMGLIAVVVVEQASRWWLRPRPAGAESSGR